LINRRASGTRPPNLSSDHAAARAQRPGGLAQAEHRVRYHGQDQVQDDRVEGRRRDGEPLPVHEREVDPAAGPWAGRREHRGSQVRRQDGATLRDVGKVGARAGADDQDSLAGPWIEKSQRVPPLPVERSDQRVVDGRPERVAQPVPAVAVESHSSTGGGLTRATTRNTTAISA
jgi:hypothetical protein